MVQIFFKKVDLIAVKVEWQMSEVIWSIIKYKPKEGCEDEFVEALRCLGNMMSENKPYEFLNEFIRLDTGEFAQIARMPNLDALIDGQVRGLTWLDSVDHLLEKYEDDSRTDAFSGFTIE